MKPLIATLQFVIGVAVAIGLAFLVPELGAKGGFLQSQVTTKLAVVLIFFLQGMSMPLDEVRAAITKVRLHLFAQLWCFVAVPILIIGLSQLVKGTLPEDLWLGFVYLAILPTTISTAVIYTTLAGGTTAAAVFNVTFSNIAGVFIVPTVMAWVVATTGEPIPLAPLLLDISKLVLLPLIAGQVVRLLWRPCKDFIKRHKGSIKQLNTLLILFIIFCTFCNSVKEAIWSKVPSASLLIAAGMSLFFLLLVSALAYGVLRLMKFERTDAIAAFFCATQKSLAAGVPMASSIFAGTGVELSLVLLPIMLFHPFCLSLQGALAGWLSHTGDKKT